MKSSEDTLFHITWCTASRDLTISAPQYYILKKERKEQMYDCLILLIYV